MYLRASKPCASNLAINKSWFNGQIPFKGPWGLHNYTPPAPPPPPPPPLYIKFLLYFQYTTRAVL